MYIVQPGDSLTTIAYRFGISTDDLINANQQIANPDLLDSGMELVIPGLEGIHGVLDTKTISYGENLSGLSQRYRISEDLLLQLNRITSPAELYAGANLIIPQDNEQPQITGQASLAEGQSLLELAVTQGTDPWVLTASNSLNGTWDALPGDILSIPSTTPPDASTDIAPAVTGVKIDPLPMVQGKTIGIKVITNSAVSLQGSFDGQELQFFPDGENTLAALQGIYALADPGLYPLQLKGTASNGTPFHYEQMVPVESGQYAQDPHLQVDPATLDPKVTEPEEAKIRGIVSKITPEKYWQGVFKAPGYDPNWITSWFGNRRQYNDDPKVYFHTGLDYGGGTGLPIKAPAAGVVVFTGALTVRGNATIIDHGWGVYSGFWHQSEIQVKVGDKVEAGQQIGLVGGTGRVTGPHLHWEVWVNGIQVDPSEWLEQTFP